VEIRPAADPCGLSDEVLAALRLNLVPGVGPRMRQELLARFGSARAVLAAAPSRLREVPGVGHKLCSAIVAASADHGLPAEIEHCRRHGVSLVIEGQPAYPRLLREIPDPPGVLFVRGTIEPQDSLAIAVVGTRHATAYGVRQAERLAGSLARAGVTIVSGLARGIDAAAHRAALEAGGRTLAVLPGSVTEVYPAEHRDLAVHIAQHGAVLSENPSDSRPRRGTFPRRNRLITGLSVGVVIVEASLRSGALISANHAMEQGREVFAVPGRVDSRASRGCHRLLRDGAKLVETVDDILDELGPLVEHVPRDRGGPLLRRPAELRLNEQEQQVLAAVGENPTTIDQVVVRSGLPVHRVLSTISVLEMRRLVTRLSGNTVVRS
jgi:DNA processing protein